MAEALRLLRVRDYIPSTSICAIGTPLISSDIIRIFFKTLLNTKADRGRTYTGCLRVCKEWYKIGITVSLKDVVLLNRVQLISLACLRLVFHTLDYLKRTRSITVYIDFPQFGSEFCGLSSDIDRLLLMATNLESLSIRQGRLSHTQSLCYTQTDLAVTRCLRLLSLYIPQSMKHLDIKVHGHCLGRQLAENRSCADCQALGKIVSGLKVFRFHGEICPAFFKDSVWSSRNALTTININMFSTSGCNLPDCRCMVENPDAVSKFALLARRLLEKGVFPHIQSFQIISELQRPMHGLPPTTESGIVVRNLVQNKTVVFPCIKSSPKSWIRYQATPGGMIIEKCESLPRLLEELEAESWSQTSHGSRLPQKDNVSDYIWLSKPNILQPNNESTLWNPAPALWRWEQEAGRLLLLPRFVNGVGEQEILKRNLCEAERKGVRLSDYSMTIEYPEIDVASVTDDSRLTIESTAPDMESLNS